MPVVRWRVTLGAKTRTAPVVAGDRVCVGLEDGTVRRLDVDTGVERPPPIALPDGWVPRGLAATSTGLLVVAADDLRPLATPDKALLAFEQTSTKPVWTYATAAVRMSVPVIDDADTLFVVGSDGSVHAVRSDGTPAWAPRAVEHALLVAPVVAGDLVVVATRDGIALLRREDGAIVAARQLPCGAGAIGMAPLQGGSLVLVAAHDANDAAGGSAYVALHALQRRSPREGERTIPGEDHDCPTLGVSLGVAPASDGRRAFGVASDESVHAFEVRATQSRRQGMSAASRGTARQVISIWRRALDPTLPGRVVAAPLVARDVLIVATADKRARAGAILALDAETGEPVWDAALDAGGRVEHTPAYRDGHIYVATKHGDVFSLACGAKDDGAVDPAALEQEGRLVEAAAVHATRGGIEGLVRAAEIHAGLGEAQRAAALFERAADRFGAECMSAERAVCQRRIIELRRLPDLTAQLVQYGEIVQGSVNSVDVTVTNEGFDLAANIHLRLQSDYLAQIAPVTIDGLPAGRSEKRSFSFKAAEFGNLPVDLEIRYVDRAQGDYTRTQQHTVTVVDRRALRRTNAPTTVIEKVEGDLIMPGGHKEESIGYQSARSRSAPTGQHT